MMRSIQHRLFILALVMSAALLMLPSNVDAAQEGHEQEGAGEEEEGEAEYHNDLALIIAGTYEGLGSEERENSFTIGGKYQRELDSRFAVAGVFEYIPTKPAALLVMPVHISIWRGLDMFVGPGVEFSGEEEEHDDGEGHDDDEEGDHSDSWHADFLIRIGVGYDIELGERYSLAPSVAIDFFRGEQALVYGADFAIKF